MADEGRKFTKVTKNIEGRGKSKVEFILGGGFGQQKLKLYEIVVSSNGNEGRVLNEMKVAGTSNAVRDYLRVLAREYSNERFRWDSGRTCYSSSEYTLLFDKIRTVEGALDAILLPAD